MDQFEVLVDGFERVRDIVHSVLNGIGAPQLTFRADATANTIAWLVWHLSRVQDAQVADVAGLRELWLEDGWAERADLPIDHAATGYGQEASGVAAVILPADLLVGYHDAVAARTIAYLRDLTASDLDRIVDDSWNPPVTLGVRLVSILSDDLQHAGQASFVRGLAERAGLPER